MIPEDSRRITTESGNTRTNILLYCLWAAVVSVIASVFMISISMIEATYRAQTIISAVSKYRNETGLYPESLDYLCPGYLKQVPDTGLGIAPHFNISKETKAPFSHRYTNKQFFGARALAIHGPFLNLIVYRWYETEKDLPIMDDRPVEQVWPRQ